MEPRTINLPVTVRVGSRPVLGPPAGGPTQVWATVEVPDDRRGGRRYELTIGAGVGNTRMAARAIHADRRHGDRRLYAQADLTPFVEALFDQLAALLERPVFACCDSPQPDPAGTCQACGAELTADQLRALVDCTHPTVADEPAGDRSPCPDCGLAWCQAVGALTDDMRKVEGSWPCPRPAAGANTDGHTLCATHLSKGVWLVLPSSHW
jgi:hypothetical protein